MNDIHEMLGDEAHTMNENNPNRKNKELRNSKNGIGNLNSVSLKLPKNKLRYSQDALKKVVNETMDKYDFSMTRNLDIAMNEITLFLADLGALSDKLQTSALADLLALEVKYVPNLANSENPDDLRESFADLSEQQLSKFIKDIQPLKNKYAQMVNFSYPDKPFQRTGQTHPIKKDFRQGSNYQHRYNGNSYQEKQQFQRSFPDNRLGVYLDPDSTKEERMTKEVLDKLKYVLPVAASVLGIVSTSLLLKKNMDEMRHKRWD